MWTPVKTFLVFFALVGAGCANGIVDVEDVADTVPEPEDAGAVDSSSWSGNGGSAGASLDAGIDPGLDAELADAEVDGSSPPLECDSRFKFSPKAPSASAPFIAKFIDEPGYVWVDLELAGPGAPTQSWQGVTGDGPHTWRYEVSGHQPGVLELTFIRDKEPGTAGKKVASCLLQIAP